MRRGFTLTEIIVASVLALAVLGLCFALLVPALRHTSNRSARAELGQAAALALMHVERELNATVAGSVKVYPEGVVLTRLAGLTPDSRPQYEPSLTVIAFEKEPHTLSLGRWTPASADPNAWIPAPAAFPELTHRKLLAAHVEEFQVNLTRPLTVRLVLIQKAAAGEPERVEMETRICLRNAS